MIHQSDYIFALIPLMILAVMGVFIVVVYWIQVNIGIAYIPGRWRWGPLGPYPKYVNQPVPFFAIKSHIYRLPEQERQQAIIGCIYRWRFAIGPIEIRRHA
jgi:hypothetical protein